jgi:hypothetical protein
MISKDGMHENRLFEMRSLLRNNVSNGMSWHFPHVCERIHIARMQMHTPTGEKHLED